MNIIDKIKQSGLTVKEYCDITGKKEKTLNHWKYGTRNPEPINFKFLIIFKKLSEYLSKEDIFKLLNKD